MRIRNSSKFDQGHAMSSLSHTFCLCTCTLGSVKIYSWLSIWPRMSANKHCRSSKVTEGCVNIQKSRP